MSYAFSHTLKQNSGNARPTHVIFADVESKLSQSSPERVNFTPFLWTAFYVHYRRNREKAEKQFHFGQDITGFWDFVESHTWQKTKTYLVTHHLEVDFMPLNGFTELQKRGWRLQRIIANGRTLILNYVKDHKKLTILNNGNLFESSIEAWGKLLNVPKLQMPDEKAPLANWITYCKRDTEIMVLMWDKLLQFLDDNELGNFKLTRASLALNAFKHRFMTHSIAIHNSMKITCLERQAYHGGRFEALKLGDFTGDKYYELDVNSMYGFVEAYSELPYELRGYKVYPSLQELKTRLERYAVIATVIIDSKEAFYPTYKKGKVKFVAGRHRVTLCTPELKYALRKGYIVKIIRMAWYYKARILHDFAKYFMALKTQYDIAQNMPMRALAKIYCNAIYGKFGQRGFEDIVIGDCDPNDFSFGQIYDADNGKREDIYKFGGKVHLVKTTLKSRDSFIAIAAHITAYARMYLYSLMTKAGIENVYHVATDSLTVNEVGYKRLTKMIHPSKAGCLKVKGCYSQYSVKGINDIAYDGVERIKGITKNAIKLNECTYVITEWPKITSLIKAGVKGGYYTRYRKKVLRRDDYYNTLNITNPFLPTKPHRITIDDVLTESEAYMLYELQSQIEALKSARRIPHKILFKTWNYKKGTWKRVRNAYGQLVEMEYSSVWCNLSELGFSDTNEYKQAALTQLSINNQIRECKAAIANIYAKAALRATQDNGASSAKQPAMYIVKSPRFLLYPPSPSPYQIPASD